MNVVQAIFERRGIVTGLKGEYSTVAEAYQNLVWYSGATDEHRSALKSADPLLTLAEVEAAVAAFVPVVEKSIREEIDALKADVALLKAPK